MYLGRITNGNSNIHEITRKINSEKARIMHITSVIFPSHFHIS